MSLMTFFVFSRSWVRITLVVFWVVLLSGLSATGARAMEESGPGTCSDEAVATEAATILADEFVYDKTLDIVTARGTVEIRYEGRTLFADTASYQKSKDRAIASGHVVVVDAEGNTTTASFVELTGDLKEGFVREIRLRLKDGSIAAAREGYRESGQTEMSDVVYSGCDGLSSSPDPTRLWQIRATSAVHDEVNKEIRYRNAWFELFGIPVAYIPYLSQPDPTVKRRSGFLSPTVSSGEGLGISLAVPYYTVIDDQQDITLVPVYHTQENPSLRVQYRGVGRNVSLVANGSITKTSDQRIRNHAEADFLASIDDTWRGGGTLALASDPGYMRHYHLGTPTYLTNRAFIEGFNRRSYGVIQGYYFQPTSTLSENDQTPLAAPLVNWSYVGAPDRYGAYSTAEVGGAVLSRETGPDSRRFSAAYGWHVPYIGPWGGVTKLDLSIRGDVYLVSDIRRRDGSLYSGSAARVVPQGSLTWSLPLYRTHEGWTDVLEPVVQAVVSPRGGNSDKIPNEDSLDFEFDDTNLFSENRFTGYDRVESGVRVNYGLKWSAYGSTIGRVEAMFGQSVRSFKDQTFTQSSGLRGHMSDYVGRIDFQPNEMLGLNYRFRLDRKTFSPRRSELSAQVGPPLFGVSLSYFDIDDQPLADGSRGKRGEISAGVTSRFSRYWTAGASLRTQLKPDYEMVRAGGFVSYEDECFGLTLDIAHDFTYADDRNSDSMGLVAMLRLNFKSLGEIGGGLGL